MPEHSYPPNRQTYQTDRLQPLLVRSFDDLLPTFAPPAPRGGSLVPEPPSPSAPGLSWAPPPTPPALIQTVSCSSCLETHSRPSVCPCLVEIRDRIKKSRKVSV